MLLYYECEWIHNLTPRVATHVPTVCELECEWVNEPTLSVLIAFEVQRRYINAPFNIYHNGKTTYKARETYDTSSPSAAPWVFNDVPPHQASHATVYSYQSHFFTCS